MKKEAKITVLLLAVLFFGWSVVCWMHPAAEYSVTERRELTQMPKISMQTLSDGSFMKEFEEYTLDQFPLRDGFRNLKAWAAENVFAKTDNNGIYVADGYAVKMEYPLKEASIENAAEKFQKLYDNDLKENAGTIFVSVIPDKNYFLAKSSGHLSMDYEKLFEMLHNAMPYAKPIEIADLLGIEDYYTGDIHWRQERLVDIAQYMSETMGITLSESYETKTWEKDFYGVYHGQTVLDIPGEKLHYLTNETLDQCKVFNYENNQWTGIYDLEKVEGKDPYDLFLSGPVSLLRIENPSATTEKELVVFRDSFGSSLIPLLAEGYQTIYLADIRYIQSDFLSKFVDFTGKDVLFLYSTVVLNNSETFK